MGFNGIYPPVLWYSLLLNMAMEILSFFINQMVDLSKVICVYQRVPIDN